MKSTADLLTDLVFFFLRTIFPSRVHSKELKALLSNNSVICYAVMFYLNVFHSSLILRRLTNNFFKKWKIF